MKPTTFATDSLLEMIALLIEFEAEFGTEPINRELDSAENYAEVKFDYITFDPYHVKEDRAYYLCVKSNFSIAEDGKLYNEHGAVPSDAVVWDPKTKQFVEQDADDEEF